MGYKKVIIGIDQSYSNTGISIFADGEKKIIRSLNMEKLDNNSIKRLTLAKTLHNAINSVVNKSIDITCIIERIRVQSQNKDKHGKPSGFISLDYIKGMGALNSVIIDTFAQYDIETYSVDTRAWKSQIIGTSKPLDNPYGVDPKKYPTILWCKDNGWLEDIIVRLPDNTHRTKGVFVINGCKCVYNDDAADSAGIALFGFNGKASNLKLEQ